MDKQEELTLEKARVISEGPITYSDDRDYLIHAEFKNNTNSTITITRVTCLFKTDDNLKHTALTTRPCPIPSGNIRELTIPFRVDLAMSAGTNCPTVEVEYTVGGPTPKVVKFDKTVHCYAIITHAPDRRQSFFISHKDPEDTEIAKKLDHYLKKIGFRGYIAEENRQPGLDLWREKIFPQIESCTGLIVIWTEKAKQYPKAICDEIEYAQKYDKRIIQLIEKNIDIQCILQNQNEYIHTNDKIVEQDLVDLVSSIYQMHTRGFFHSHD